MLMLSLPWRNQARKLQPMKHWYAPQSVQTIVVHLAALASMD
jgi:hypothetical protein